MPVEPQETAVLKALRDAVASPGLSEAARASGQTLLNRLEFGVRVTIMGPDNVGKSTLCAALLQQPAAGGATAVYRHTSVRSGAEDSAGIILSDAEILKGLEITDLAGSASRDARAAALTGSDIVLWCTERFEPEEEAQWSAVPDYLKDHSFLVLTCADEHAKAKKLQSLMSHLSEVAAEEFHSFFPVAAERVAAKSQQSGPVKPEQMAASGVAALSDALHDLAASGRSADLDSAVLYLERYGFETTQAAGNENTNLRDATGSLDAVRRMIEKHAGQFASLDAQSPSDLCEAAVTLSQRVSDDINDLSSDVSATKDGQTRLWDDLNSAADKILLASLEADLRSAADAATIVLQLKRDLYAGAFA